MDYFIRHSAWLRRKPFAGGFFPLYELARVDPVKALQGRVVSRTESATAFKISIAGFAVMLASFGFLAAARFNVYLGFAGAFFLPDWSKHDHRAGAGHQWLALRKKKTLYLRQRASRPDSSSKYPHQPQPHCGGNCSVYDCPFHAGRVWGQ